MKKQPKIVVPKSVQLPAVEVVTLPNGLALHTIRTAGQQVVRASLVWSAGSVVQSKPFTASSTLNLLAEGSERYTSHQIAEKLDFVGSFWDVSADRDYAMATIGSLDKFFAPTLEMLDQIVLHPTFPPDEVDLYARKRMERLALERSKPATKARELFSAALFGEKHPYGISAPESAYLDLGRGDVVGFYDTFYGADNCFTVCSMGDDDAALDGLIGVLSQLPAHRLPEGYEPPVVEPHSTAYRYLPIEGALQSAVRIGRLLFGRSHPDFVGMQVVATILGGYFGSRLTQNLREERGYTYGVMAAMINLRRAGYMAIAAEVGAEVTADAVEQIFFELNRLRTELVSEDELDTVRRSMLGEVMRIVDGPMGMVDVVVEQVQIGAEAGYINEFIGQIWAITPERILQLAQKYLVPDDFTTVIVGRE